MWWIRKLSVLIQISQKVFHVLRTVLGLTRSGSKNYTDPEFGSESATQLVVYVSVCPLKSPKGKIAPDPAQWRSSDRNLPPLLQGFLEMQENKQQIIGSSTACLMMLSHTDLKLYTANIGRLTTATTRPSSAPDNLILLCVPDERRIRKGIWYLGFNIEEPVLFWSAPGSNFLCHYPLINKGCT